MHPVRLAESDAAMDLYQLHSVCKIKFESFRVQNILCPLEEVRQKFVVVLVPAHVVVSSDLQLSLAKSVMLDVEFFWCQRIVVVRVVQFLRILEVDFQNATAIRRDGIQEVLRIFLQSFEFARLHPSEPRDRQLLRHCPTIQVVGIDVGDGLVGLCRIVQSRTEIGVIGASEPLADHADPAAHASCNKLVHSGIGDEIKFDFRVLEHRVPSQLRRSHVMCRIQLVVLNAYLAKRLENVSQEQHI